MENESTIVDVNTRKRRVRTVISRVSCSTRSRSSQPPRRSQYLGKTASATTSASWVVKQHLDGNNLHASWQKEKDIDNRRLAEVNDLPEWLDRRNINESSARKTYRDTWSRGDAQNVEPKFAEKPNQRSLYTHHHNAEYVFETNAKESLILQATSTPSNHSMKLYRNDKKQHYSESASESTGEETGSMDACRNEYSNNLVVKQSSEESLLSDQYNLRGSKSAPEIMERSEYEFNSGR